MTHPILRSGFYYIEEDINEKAMYTLTLMMSETSEYGPDHNPWFLSHVFYELRNDYEVFAKVAWVDHNIIARIDNTHSISEVLKGHQPSGTKISYCITNGIITVPSKLFENHIDNDDQHMKEYLSEIEDDHGVPGSSISDQIYEFTRRSQWGPVSHMFSKF